MRTPSAGDERGAARTVSESTGEAETDDGQCGLAGRSGLRGDDGRDVRSDGGRDDPPAAPAQGWPGGGPDRPPAADRVLDLTGRHLLPGFVDVHLHLSQAAWFPRGGDALDWTGL